MVTAIVAKRAVEDLEGNSIAHARDRKANTRPALVSPVVRNNGCARGSPDTVKVNSIDVAAVNDGHGGFALRDRAIVNDDGRLSARLQSK